MTTAILQIIAFLLPILYEAWGSGKAKKERENEAFDKALASGDVADITRLLSERYDRVRDQNNRGA
jgi:hypothetical protein